MNTINDTSRWRRVLIRWVKVLLLLYGVIGIALYYLQDRLLFHPVPVDRHAKYDFKQPYTELNIPYDKETNLNVFRFKSTGDTTSKGGDTTPKGVVLYFHGNNRNTAWYASYAANFTQKGYEVWMMDYPGFGKSTGVFNEQNLYTYAGELYKLARSQYKPEQIILYGKSLGTGIATQLASIRPCRRLILECPYFSMTSLVGQFLPVYPVKSMLRYRFPTNEYLPAVKAPATLLHGTDDWLIPYSNAERLKPLLKPGDEFVPIEGAGHNNLNDFALFHQKLDSLLAKP